MNDVLGAIILFLPAGVANMTPILANKVPGLNRWNTPVDFGLHLRGRRIFGDHKTWRGVLTGTVIGTLVGLALPHGLVENVYPSVSWAVFAASSFGALFGDAAKSFFKRQFNHASGTTWFPFDQIDYILGGLLFMVPFGVPSLRVCATILCAYFSIHLISTFLGYKLGLKSSPI